MSLHIFFTKSDFHFKYFDYSKPLTVDEELGTMILNIFLLEKEMEFHYFDEFKIGLITLVL